MSLITTKCMKKKKRHNKFSKTNEEKQGRSISESNIDIKRHFLRVHRPNKPTPDVGRTREKFVNQEAESSHLQAFLV